MRYRFNLMADIENKILQHSTIVQYRTPLSNEQFLSSPCMQYAKIPLVLFAS